VFLLLVVVIVVGFGLKVDCIPFIRFSEGKGSIYFKGI